MLRRLLLLLTLLVAPAIGRAQHIRPELIAETAATPGGEVELAILMHTSPGWHGYWLNPGDAGLPMDVQWQVPSGASLGPLRYPVPTRLQVAGLMNYVYERDYALLTRLKVAATARTSVPVRASARWLACTDKICVPEQGEFSLDVPVGRGGQPDPRFDGWRAALPLPLATPARYVFEGGKVRLGIPLPTSVSIHDPYVFPITDNVVDYEGTQRFTRNGNWIVVEMPTKAPARGSFEGVLATGDGRGFQFRTVGLLVPQPGEPLEQTGWPVVVWAIVGALAGGILLNLMPCVFPILALKAVHLARAGGEEREARADAVAYAAGATAGTALLGCALLLIKAAGAEAGWAFQLQDPRTVLLLLLLAVAITANLLGLFELPVLGGRARPAGGFATGALAAFVATPCAGPFLGAALGTALLLPIGGALAVFAALGLGLALPFVAVAFIPRMRKLLPRPGPWMRRLQRFLAIPMLATAVACAWLLDREAGQRGLIVAIVAGSGVALLLWAFGRAQRHGSGLRLLLSLAALAIAPLALWQLPARGTPVATHQAGEAWSPEKVAAYRAQGKAVFVYFTADWCLTCKANEAAAIDREAVTEAFRGNGVKVLVGDWTNGDPAITRFLEDRGRAGVPLYLWYAKGAGEPEELPQVLTPGMLISRAQARR